MHTDKGGEVPDAQGAPADAEQALAVCMQLLHRLAVARQRAQALALLQVPHLQNAVQLWPSLPMQRSDVQLQQISLTEHIHVSKWLSNEMAGYDQGD